MNKDEARGAAIKHAYQEYTYGGELFTGKCSVSRQAFKVIYLAGAASVDRRAIVEKAFERVKDVYDSGTWANKSAYTAVFAVMDAVIAEMGGEE